jgi:hypothetical protein
MAQAIDPTSRIATRNKTITGKNRQKPSVKPVPGRLCLVRPISSDAALLRITQ